MNSKLTALLSGAALVAAGLAGTVPAVADPGSVQTTEPVYSNWDTDNPTGRSRLVRTPEGITAIVQTSGLPKGQAITLWFIIVNNPQHCWSTPSTLEDALFNPDGAGVVTGGCGRATCAGHLAVGDVSGSGKVETGLGEAEVLLALHSHGPKQRGLALRSQLSSFTGGCAVFLGDVFGWAEVPEDMPDAVGECTTFQSSRH